MTIKFWVAAFPINIICLKTFNWLPRDSNPLHLVCKLIGCGFDFFGSHSNFRHRICFKQWAVCRSGNFRANVDSARVWEMTKTHGLKTFVFDFLGEIYEKNQLTWVKLIYGIYKSTLIKNVHQLGENFPSRHLPA